MVTRQATVLRRRAAVRRSRKGVRGAELEGDKDEPTGGEDMPEAALIVVDMLRDFVEEGGKLFCGEAATGVVAAVEEEIKEARAKDLPVIYVCDSHTPTDSEFAMFPPHCLVGTRGAEVLPRLAPLPGDPVIRKRRFSSFFATDLDLTLRELGVSELRLVGVCTNICILYTAADARMRSYKVVVPRRAVASFDAGAHDWALGEMERVLGVKVL